MPGFPMALREWAHYTGNLKGAGKMNDNDSVSRLCPQGVLSIERAAELRKGILEAFESGNQVDIDFSGIDDVDLSCVQVLLGAKREAQRRGLAIRLSGTLSKRVARRLRNCGFVVAMPETGRDLESTLIGWAEAGS